MDLTRPVLVAVSSWVLRCSIAAAVDVGGGGGDLLDSVTCKSDLFWMGVLAPPEVKADANFGIMAAFRVVDDDDIVFLRLL